MRVDNYREYTVGKYFVKATKLRGAWNVHIFDGTYKLFAIRTNWADFDKCDAQYIVDEYTRLRDIYKEQ